MADENFVDNGNETNPQDSSNPPKDTTEYLKPWIKNLGKAFAQNKEIAEYDSLSECVAGLLKRPKAKAIPEAYDGFDEKLSNLFKDSCLTKEEAKAIDGYYQELIPKKADLKDVFKDKYEATMKSFDKGKTVLKDIANEADKNGLSEHPTFIKLMAIIGDNAGSSNFIPPQGNGKERTAIEKLVLQAYGEK